MPISKFERIFLLATTLGTALTGVIYLWMKYFMEPSEPWAVINHPLQPWMLKAHILVAPLLVFAIGTVALRHVWHHWRTGIGKGLKTGLLTAAMIAPMVVSGYLVQTITNPAALKIVALSHIAFGLVYALGFGTHQFLVGLGQSREESPSKVPGVRQMRRRRKDEDRNAA